MITTQVWEKCKDTLIDAIGKLKGSDKRIALAMIAKDIGIGGQSFVSKEFKVSRDTIRAGMREIENGVSTEVKVETRGRKKIEKKLLHLVEDIKDIIDSENQTDPSFKTTKPFTKLTSKEIRKQLITQKNYTDDELPTVQTINNKIKVLGFNHNKVNRLIPKKKIEETDKILKKFNQVTDENKGKDNIVTISIDAKALDRNYITPFCILDLNTDKAELTFTESKVTADFIVDTIELYWINTYASTLKDTLIIHSYNDLENSSRRTQFIKRIIEFSSKLNVKVILLYYPPYYCKYNPVERVWRSLERDILDTKEATLGFAKTMVWKGSNPLIKVTNTIYETGKKVENKTTEIYEQSLDRDSEIEKWFITIKHD